jgi:hypothetical protein
MDTTRVSKVTIGRLHNLGNYEHVRYEVTVEVSPYGDAASVIARLEKLLARLSPKSPVDSWTLNNAKRDLNAPELPDDPRDAERRIECAKVIAKHAEWLERRGEALRKFNEIGGTTVHTDAKDFWDDPE